MNSLYVILIAVTVAIALLSLLLFVASRNSFENKMERDLKKSVEKRSAVSARLNEIQDSLKNTGFNSDESEKALSLKDSLSHCRYLIRDGRRSLDKLNFYSDKLEKDYQAYVKA